MIGWKSVWTNFLTKRWNDELEKRPAFIKGKDIPNKVDHKKDAEEIKKKGQSILIK